MRFYNLDEEEMGLVNVGWKPIKSFEDELAISGKKVSYGNLTSGINYGNIEFQNVYFSYQNKQVLNNINLRLTQNKITSIIGKSGTGKSTLVKLLLGILPSNQGNILVDGKRLLDFDNNYLHDNIAMVSQGKRIHTILVCKVHMVWWIPQGIKRRTCDWVGV